MNRLTPERWQSVKAVLATALELDGDARALYVDAACAGDRALAQEVERLLRADAMAGATFLDELPPLADDDAESTAPGDPWIGRRIGAYRIVEALGAGGMGAVYRATRIDGAYRADVAIKVVRDAPGAAFVNRFKTERQILAALEHPNIARLLDGGTTTGGGPYFVMELIEGIPITEYANRNALTIDAKLHLFLIVCSAVEYAHQHLIVHRDIKPSNILVTGDSIPKLLDFGIARIVGSPASEPLSPTMSGPWPMTPAYASPEQLRGETITTATDVYSLGLVLYELLTGRRAFDVAEKLPYEAARILLETEPARPSIAVRQLAGDLDTIVLKAIRKDPRERYSSAEQLAADIQRYLDGRPIAARKDTLRYRAAKFVRRNAAALCVAAVVSAVLAATGAIAIRSTSLAHAERIRAEERVDDLRQLARSNLFELHDAIQALPGSAPARNLLIQRTLHYLDHLNTDGGGTRDLQQELAVGYERIAELQGNFSGPGIGDSRAALASYRKAVAIRESLVAAHRDDATELSALGDLLTNYSLALQKVSRTAEASRVARRALSVCERVAQLRAPDARALTDEAIAHARLASVVGGTGSSGSTREIASAIDHDRRALAILTLLPSSAVDARVRRVTEQVQLHLGFHLAKARLFAESTRVFDALLLHDRAHPVLSPADLMLVYNYRGLTFDRAGEYRRALGEYEAQLEIARAAASAEPGDVQATIGVAIAEGDVGIETARLGRPRVGLAEITDAIATGERLLAANPSELFYADLLTVAYAYQAETLSSIGRHMEAAAKYAEALRRATDVSRADPDDLESPLSIAKIHAALGAVLGRAQRYADASKEVEAARGDLARLQHRRPADAEAAYVAALNDANGIALRNCRDHRPCAAGTLQLPSLLN